MPKKNVLVFTTWSYKDGLIQAATIPYLKMIAAITHGNIFLICLEQPGLLLSKAEADAANAELLKYRIRLIRFNYHKNKLRATLDWGLRIPYLILFSYLRRINYFHPMCTPAGGLAWIVSKFKKIHFAVDSFEPHAEVMVETGVWQRTSKLFRLIFALEKKVAARADHILAISKNIYTYIRETYKMEPPAGKILYRPLCVNPDLFVKSAPDYSLIGRNAKGSRVIGVYTGKIGGMYYDEELCTFIKECIRFWKGDFHLIVCTAMDKAETTEFFLLRGIEQEFFTVNFIDHTRIPAYLSLADFGISFSRPSETRKYGCPTKNAEYWSMGLPVITTDAILDDTNNIINHPYLGVVLGKTPDNNMNAELSALDNLIANREKHASLIREFAIIERSFATVRNVYERVYS